ncbi:MAG: hypothetical protein MI785_16015 [Kiloniellales bacterium]|nr:hypothetical protein [Kiloniellales bacterium]
MSGAPKTGGEAPAAPQGGRDRGGGPEGGSDQRREPQQPTGGAQPQANHDPGHPGPTNPANGSPNSPPGAAGGPAAGGGERQHIGLSDVFSEAGRRFSEADQRLSDVFSAPGRPQGSGDGPPEPQDSHAIHSVIREQNEQWRNQLRDQSVMTMAQSEQTHWTTMLDIFSKGQNQQAEIMADINTGKTKVADEIARMLQKV